MIKNEKVVKEDDSTPSMWLKSKELKKLRESYNLTAEEVANELNIAENHFRMKEAGKRLYKNESDNENFYYRVCHAIEKLAKRYQSVEYLEELAIQEDADNIKELYHAPLTDKNYKEIVKKIKNRENLIAVCSEYYVDFEEVQSRLKEDGLFEYILGNRYKRNLELGEYLRETTDNLMSREEKEEYTLPRNWDVRIMHGIMLEEAV